MSWEAPLRRRSWADIRVAGACAIAACLGACAPPARTCTVSGLEETEAILALTQAAGRVDSFRYYMSRPVGLSAHECSVNAQRKRTTREEGFKAGFYPSSWSDTREGTRVFIAPDTPGGERLLIFASRPSGVRLAFLGPSHCGTFMLPHAVEFRWNEKGCHGQAIGWPREERED